MDRHRAIAAALLAGLAALTLAGAAPAAAQQARGGTVLGRVVAAETGEPLNAASVVLRLPGETDAVATTVTDATGRFQFTGLAAGRYSVEAGYLGYSPTARTVTVEASGTVDLGTLELSVAAIQVEPLTVDAGRPPAVFAPDRDIYSAESLPAAAGGVATELLSAVPELEVDIDGTVQLRGSSPQIYINGRPAPMQGEALTAFLEQLPADRIERIEVIPNPSARYDAEGAGGIVNIVLKEGVELGTTGSAFANVNSRGSAGLGGRVSSQRGPLTFNVAGFLRRSDQESTGYDLRENLLAEPPTRIRRDSWSDRGNLSGSADLNTELRLSQQTAIRAQGRFADFGAESDSRTTTTHMDAAEQWTQRYHRSSSVRSARRSLDLELGFDHAFEPERHVLEVELELESGRNDEDERVETEFELLGPDPAPLPAALTLEDSGNRDRETTLEVDYVRPWGESGQLELGYRGSFQRRDDHRLLEEFEEIASGEPTLATEQGFTHGQDVHSGYLTLMREIGPLGVQVGVRVQHTGTRFELPSGEAFERSDVDVFPSANITFEAGDGARLRFSYSRRTRRPGPWLLNPIDQSTDPLNRRVGNPDLEPQYTHSFGLDASLSTWWGTLRFSPYYRRVENDWAQIQRVDENGVSTRTWENVASQDVLGLSFTASARSPDGWGGFVSVNGYHERREAGNMTADISGRSFRWSVRGNVSGRVSPTLDARAHVAYTPAHDVPQGRVSSRVDSSIGLRQRLLDGRASLNLNVNDPFDISQTQFESRDPTFVQLGRSRVSRRHVSLGFSYNFGGGTRGG